MDKSATTAWLGTLSATEKVRALLSVMHELTIVVRSVFHDYSDDCATRSRLAYKISELNHMLTSAALGTIENRATYPDDVLVETLSDQSRYPELAPYFPFVLERVAQQFHNRAE